MVAHDHTSDPHGPNSFRRFGKSSSIMIGESLREKKPQRGEEPWSLNASTCACRVYIMRLAEAEPWRGKDFGNELYSDRSLFTTAYKHLQKVLNSQLTHVTFLLIDHLF